MFVKGFPKVVSVTKISPSGDFKGPSIKCVTLKGERGGGLVKFVFLSYSIQSKV